MRQEPKEWEWKRQSYKWQWQTDRTLLRLVCSFLPVILSSCEFSVYVPWISSLYLFIVISLSLIPVASRHGPQNVTVETTYHSATISWHPAFDEGHPVHHLLWSVLSSVSSTPSLCFSALITALICAILLSLSLLTFLSLLFNSHPFPSTLSFSLAYPLPLLPTILFLFRFFSSPLYFHVFVFLSTLRPIFLYFISFFPSSSSFTHLLPTLIFPIFSSTSIQRRQSGLKSGGRGPGSTKFRFFQPNFREISIF